MLVYPNLSMMLTPSCTVEIFTCILKKSGFCVTFRMHPYNSNLECLGEPDASFEGKKYFLFYSQSFNSNTPFGAPKTDLKAVKAPHYFMLVSMISIDNLLPSSVPY